MPEDEPEVEPEDDSEPPDVTGRRGAVEVGDRRGAGQRRSSAGTARGGSRRRRRLGRPRRQCAHRRSRRRAAAGGRHRRAGRPARAGGRGRRLHRAAIVRRVRRHLCPSAGQPVLQLFGIELNGTTARISRSSPTAYRHFRPVRPDSDERGLRGVEERGRWPPRQTVGQGGGRRARRGVHLTASLFHWSTYASLARRTGATVIVPLYRAGQRRRHWRYGEDRGAGDGRLHRRAGRPTR